MSLHLHHGSASHLPKNRKNFTQPFPEIGRCPQHRTRIILSRARILPSRNRNSPLKKWCHCLPSFGMDLGFVGKFRCHWLCQCRVRPFQPWQSQWHTLSTGCQRSGPDRPRPDKRNGRPGMATILPFLATEKTPRLRAFLSVSQADRKKPQPLASGMPSSQRHGSRSVQQPRRSEEARPERTSSKYPSNSRSNRAWQNRSA